MAKNGKFFLIIIGAVFLIMINMQQIEKKEGKLEAVKAALPPITLGANQIIQVDKFPLPSIYSIVQSSGLFAMVPGPGGDWCYDSSCSCQCTGSFDFCDNWLNKKSPCAPAQGEIIYTCPSGTVDIGNNKCCPNSYPNYCSKDNLCYVESNCGVGGVLGDVMCRANFNKITCKEYNAEGITPFTFCGGVGVTEFGLARLETFDEVSDCSTGTKIQLLSSSSETPKIYQCRVTKWTDTNIKDEIAAKIPISFDGTCDSCSNNLCVRSDRCTLGQIKCINKNQYTTCEQLTLPYFANPYKDFTNLIQSCPAGNVCSNNACIPDLSGVCNDIKIGVLNLITAWANSPSETAKSQILTKITNWAGIC